MSYYSKPIPTNYQFTQFTQNSTSSSSLVEDLALLFPTMVHGTFSTPIPTSTVFPITLPLFYSGSLSSTNSQYIQSILFSTYGVSSGIQYTTNSIITFLPWTISTSPLLTNIYYSTIANISQLNATVIQSSSSNTVTPNYVTIGPLPASTAQTFGVPNTACILVNTTPDESKIINPLSINLGLNVPTGISAADFSYSLMILN